METRHEGDDQGFKQADCGEKLKVNEVITKKIKGKMVDKIKKPKTTFIDKSSSEKIIVIGRCNTIKINPSEALRSNQV